MNLVLISTEKKSKNQKLLLFLFHFTAQVWTRPVLPQKTRNIPSYAVAFVSHRTDGAPYTVQFNVTDLGMKSRKGYTITVRKLWTINDKKKYICIIFRFV